MKLRFEGLLYFATFVNVWTLTHVFRVGLSYFRVLGWGLRENIKLAKGFECNGYN
jgi:hypothetical protein